MTGRRAGKRPAPRTIDVAGTGDFEDWTCRALVDFRASWLVELQSGDVARLLAVLERIIVSHNFPDSDGNVAATLADVDPYDGLMLVANEVADAIGKLPPR